MGGQPKVSTFAEVSLVHFSDETGERLYVVEYNDDYGSLLKTEYYKNKQAAYEAAAEVNEKN